MLVGVVVGHATSTVRHPSLKGWRLLAVQPLAPDGRTPEGEPILAVDGLGAGRGALVIISSDGKGTRELLGSETTPARWSVIAICDNPNLSSSPTSTE
jgi:ethanolamine utilization protein EutN